MIINPVNALLWFSSLSMTMFLLHQLFAHEKGSSKHRRNGAVTMCLGLIIVVCITIRGAEQETMSPLYIVHLLTGGPFIICLFTTGYLGWKATRAPEIARRHALMGRVTGILLLLTLAVGALARLPAW